MNLTLLIPEFLLAGLGFLVLGADLFLPRDKKHLLAYGSAAALAAIAISSLYLLGKQESLFSGVVLIDGYSLFFKLFFLLLGILVLLASVDYVKAYLSYAGEFYGLIIFSVLAMILMVAAGELLSAYIALELLSFSLYVLASYARHDPKSNEAGVKYILIGAFSTGILLYGLSLIYGSIGTTFYHGIAQAIQAGKAANPGFVAGLILVIAGLGFKVAAVPFHMWAPDVYEGAPVPVTAYLSVASKAASFAWLLRLFVEAFSPAFQDWRPVIIALAALSMTVGNLVAIHQRNIKRLLAYSSIGQAGYILTGIAALSPLNASFASTAVVFHVIGYAITNLTAFACIIAYYNLTGKDEIPDYDGLAMRNPFIAFVLAIALFSAAGLPIFVGFTTKFYLFTAAAKDGLLWLAALAIVNSVISLYYYLVVIRHVYISSPKEEGRLHLPRVMSLELGVLTSAIVLLGVYPGPLVRLITAATGVLFS